MSDTAIAIRDVVKRYNLYPNSLSMALDWAGFYKLRFWKPASFSQKFALNNVNLDIRKGERYGLIGRNGAGKTTLLKILAGLIAPTSGKIDVHGNIQSIIRIGGGFHPDFTGRQNVRFGLLYRGLRGKELDRAVDGVIDFAELGSFIDEPISTYSLGMTTRLQFGAATAIRPDILLIDEVLGAGDAYFSEKSSERMKGLTHSGCTLILVSHAKSQILEFCNQGIWLDAGQVREQGNIQTVMNSYEQEMLRAINQISDGKTTTQKTSIPTPPHMKRRFILDKIEGPFTTLTWNDAVSDSVQRTGSAPGSPLQIADVRVLSGEQNFNHLDTGEPLDFVLSLSTHLEAQTDLDVLCHNANGELVAADSVSLPAGQQKITYSLHPLCLGHGDYLFSFFLKKGDVIKAAAAGVYVKVNETNDSDPPFLHYLGKWYKNGDDNAEFSRIYGMQ